MAAPLYNPNLLLTPNATRTNTSLLQQNISGGLGILGAAPPPAGTVREKGTRNGKKYKRTASRWDVAAAGGEIWQGPQGSTTYTPGAATWKRYDNAANIPVSPCRSDANSAMANSYEHDPWPLHTPNVSLSQGTQDSRMGAFSPPQIARDYYVTLSNQAGHFMRTEQGQLTAHVETQQHLLHKEGKEQNQSSANKETELDKAEAPAYKAPRAP